MMTKGEYRVGITFNPSADPTVDQIKRQAADLIDLIETLPKTNDPLFASEQHRLMALAQTHVEDAAMWAVKAATKQAPPDGRFANLQNEVSASATVHLDPFEAAVKESIETIMGSVGPWSEPLQEGHRMRILSQLQKRGFRDISGADIDAVLPKIRQVSK